MCPAGGAAVPAETAEPPDFDPVAATQGGADGLENFDDRDFHIFRGELRETFGESGGEFGAGHAGILPRPPTTRIFTGLK